jgi:hypothetical protein
MALDDRTFNKYEKVCGLSLGKVTWYIGETPHQCQSVLHISHTIWPGIKLGSLRLNFGDLSSELRSLTIKLANSPVCLPFQKWAETSVWFVDDGISTFHSCVVVDLYRSLSEWRLLLSERVLVCRRENIAAWIREMSVWQFLASKQTTVLEHPPYSPDLAPSNFLCSLT